MVQTPRHVVVTGAAGRIGRAIVPLLPTDWKLRRTDLTTGDGINALDVTDLEACRNAFIGADAVVHLAAVPDPAASWEELLPSNVLGVHQVAQAAADCDVPRLVLASSLHAVSAMPDGSQSRAGDAPRPGNLYGATKAWAEAVGAWLAATTSTSVVALRIGYFAEARPDPAAISDRDRCAWLSRRDAAELIRAAVEAEGLDFVVANGISANRYRVADLQTTIQYLGYRPLDDAWSTS
jgi:nucleoside-diphosphate-sugar epimerase